MVTDSHTRRNKALLMQGHGESVDAYHSHEMKFELKVLCMEDKTTAVREPE